MNKITAVLALTATQAYADTCYALAFSSGDQSSAYQAGVLKGLVETYGGSETNYTAVSGVSGGGVNAAILGSFPVGQEASAAQRMITFWQNSSNNKLYKDWLGGIVEGLTIKAGLYNDALLKQFLATELADIGAMQRFVYVGITDALKGTWQDNTSNLDTNLQDVMFASFSYAGFFPPANVFGGEFFDGSVIWDLDIFSAVNKCLETHSASDVVVDVLLTHNKTLRHVDASGYNSIQMLIRYLEVSHYYGVMDGLLRAQFAYPGVTFRHIISPSSQLASTLYPLSLDQSQVDADVSLGFTDGVAAVSNGLKNAQDTLYYFSLKKQRDPRIKGVSFEEFVELKKKGVFDQEYKVLQDTKLQNLFLQ